MLATGVRGLPARASGRSTHRSDRRPALGREVPGVGVDLGAVGAEHAQLLSFGGELPVPVLVEEDVVSPAEWTPLSTEVAPPCSQWWKWWMSAQGAGTSHPG